MRTHIVNLVLAACCAGSLDAQATLSLGYSAAGRVEPHAIDSLYITLRDGDYAKLIVAHEHNGGICGGACATPDGRPAFVNRDATTEPNWLAQVALKLPSPGARFFLSVGGFEFDQSGTGGNILEETRRLRDILRAKNARVIYRQFVGGHDGLTWPGMMAEGLQLLLGSAR